MTIWTITTLVLPSSVCQSFYCKSVKNSVVLPTAVNSVHLWARVLTIQAASRDCLLLTSWHFCSLCSLQETMAHCWLLLFVVAGLPELYTRYNFGIDSWILNKHTGKVTLCIMAHLGTLYVHHGLSLYITSLFLQNSYLWRSCDEDLFLLDLSLVTLWDENESHHYSLLTNVLPNFCICIKPTFWIIL